MTPLSCAVNFKSVNVLMSLPEESKSFEPKDNVRSAVWCLYLSAMKPMLGPMVHATGIADIAVAFFNPRSGPHFGEHRWISTFKSHSFVDAENGRGSREGADGRRRRHCKLEVCRPRE